MMIYFFDRERLIISCQQANSSPITLWRPVLRPRWSWSWGCKRYSSVGVGVWVGVCVCGCCVCANVSITLWTLSDLLNLHYFNWSNVSCKFSVCNFNLNRLKNYTFKIKKKMINIILKCLGLCSHSVSLLTLFLFVIFWIVGVWP